MSNFLDLLYIIFFNNFIVVAGGGPKCLREQASLSATHTLGCFINCLKASSYPLSLIFWCEECNDVELAL